jgi:hypothetical protein
MIFVTFHEQYFLHPLCLSSYLAPHVVFLSTTLLTGMTGISLHVLWRLTSQLHLQFYQREQLFSLLRIKLCAHSRMMFYFLFYNILRLKR